MIIYGQRTADGRIAFGGRGAPYHFGSRIDPAFDRRRAGARDARRRRSASCSPCSPTSTSRTTGAARSACPATGTAPCASTARPGWPSAGGYVGDGVATTNLAGRTLADLITGRDSDLVRLPWVEHPLRRWEPEPLRWLGVNVARRAAAGADAAEAAHGPAGVVAGARPGRRLLDALTGH